MIHIDDEPFRRITDQLMANSRQEQAVRTDQVFQPANMKNRVLVEQIISYLVKPGSGIVGFEHLQDLYRRAASGESCLLLAEHYSNFDIPCLFLLAKNYEGGEEIMESVVAMAGSKLNEESRFVLAFTEAYTRIVIYPARALQALEGKEGFEEVRQRARTMNRSALREMIRVKNSGHIVLLFPAGTRFRPDRPESRKVLLETDSYIKGFDNLLFVGIAGNTLMVNSSGDMEKDIPQQDVMVYACSPVTASREFRAAARERAGAAEGGDEGRRAVADAVEKRLLEMHHEAEAARQPLL